VPRPEPSVYSGDIIRPVPRPGPAASEDDAELNRAAVLPTPADLPPQTTNLVSNDVSEVEEFIDATALPETDLVQDVDLSAQEGLIDAKREVNPGQAIIPIPELAGGPAFFRPLPRPAGVVEAKPEPNLDGLQGVVASLRPKPRPASLVVRAGVASPKPSVLRVVPKPTLVAKPAPVPAPVAKPKPVAKPTPPVAPTRPADVVMVGDSITAGGRWSSRFPEVTIVNRGISGDTGLKILARMDGILATNAKTALVMFGINDIYNGVPVERILQRYDQIITILQSRKIKVVIQSTLACSGHICGEKLTQVHALNAGLVKIAKAKRLKYVDINKGLSDRAGLRRDFSSDGIHLNGDGYATWYAMLRPHIKS